MSHLQYTIEIYVYDIHFLDHCIIPICTLLHFTCIACHLDVLCPPVYTVSNKRAFWVNDASVDVALFRFEAE